MVFIKVNGRLGFRLGQERGDIDADLFVHLCCAFGRNVFRK